MILYHGTSTKHLKSILKNGLQPRNVTGNSNWEGKIESKAGFVYLTDAYPVYFAFCAAKEECEDLLVVAVRVTEKDLYPDEDFIAHCLHREVPHFQKMALADINPLVNLEVYKRFAMASLTNNGLVAVRGVAPDHIKGHVIINRDKIQEIMCIGGDSIPSPLPYRIMGEHYRNCMKALFKGGLKAAMKVVEERNRPFMEMQKQLDTNIVI